jgi:hypothetical protein
MEKKCEPLQQVSSDCKIHAMWFQVEQVVQVFLSMITLL